MKLVQGAPEVTHSNPGKTIYLNHCGISPLLPEAREAQAEFDRLHSELGAGVFGVYPNVLGQLHEAAARLLETAPENISFLKNTAEGLSLIASSYPFREGDEILSYAGEYPSNHYPWKLQESRGVRLRLLSDAPVSDSQTRRAEAYGSWLFSELEASITKRTRVVAISHVQFTSGFAADLRRVGELCKAHGIDLIVDAAQSLGALSVLPEEWGIAAVAASGWKWLRGPIGTGLLYTSPQLRERLAFTMAGADVVRQGDDYLNHTWDPYTDGRRFEYSTAPVGLAVGLRTCIEDFILKKGQQGITQKLKEYRNLLLSGLDSAFFSALRFPSENESAITSFLLPEGRDPVDFAKKAVRAGVIVSSRGGYLRIAPHHHTTLQELKTAMDILNTLAKS